MKIYTGSGDGGKTSLLSGERVSKSDLRVEAYDCHSEPFDLLRVNSAKIPRKTGSQEVLRRPAICGTPQNYNRKEGFPDGH